MDVEQLLAGPNHLPQGLFCPCIHIDCEHAISQVAVECEELIFLTPYADDDKSDFRFLVECFERKCQISWKVVEVLEHHEALVSNLVHSSNDIVHVVRVELERCPGLRFRVRVLPLVSAGPFVLPTSGTPPFASSVTVILLAPVTVRAVDWRTEYPTSLSIEACVSARVHRFWHETTW